MEAIVLYYKLLGVVSAPDSLVKSVDFSCSVARVLQCCIAHGKANRMASKAHIVLFWSSLDGYL